MENMLACIAVFNIKVLHILLQNSLYLRASYIVKAVSNHCGQIDKTMSQKCWSV